ncbi:proliferation marker protein Ki-67-like isoform X4 [Diabrotica virgifera virgifera]|uniref:FHA domain-containing protein n=1 Tax=Diabrotica virgifera virgifera TaxID=50390 RepID=A0ABM5JLY3_DIAVI|nr:proliferation marker protein Ki-67-like isoform X4 [Diabrotica virgifera virgifera]
MDSPNGQDGFLLFFKKTGETGAEYPLSKGETTIGADDDADVRIKILDTRIEIIHCTIDVNEDGRATITNLSESNPIKVNNNLVRNTRKLSHNDMIQVVTKKFQYKKSLIENKDTKTNRKSLTPFKKSTKKSPTFKTKAVTPRFQAVSSSSSKLFPVALPFRAKSRLSLHTPTNTSNKHVTNSKMESLIPQLKITPWKNTLRKSSVKEIQPKKSIGNRASSLSKKSLTRRSRNKLASDESEKLRMSSCSSYSPLNRSLSREISSEDENIFVSVPKEKTPIQRRSIKSKSETKVLPTNTRKSSTYSTNKHSSTTKKYSSSAKTMKDLSGLQNASPIKVISARKSLQNNTTVVSPRARKSLKFNKSEQVTFEFSGLEEEIFARSELSLQLDSTDTDDSISDIKNVSARKSSKNRSRKSLNISQPKSEINTSAMEKYPSPKVSSPVKSIRTPVGRNSIKSNKSSTDCSMSPLRVSSPTKSARINQSKIDDFNNSDFEINFSPTRVSSTRKSTVRKSAAMDQFSTINQSGDESLETTKFKEIVPLEISSISKKSTKGNKSMKELSKRSGYISEFLNTSSTPSKTADVSPSKPSMNKSLQSNVSRSAKMNVSQDQVDMLSPTRVPTRKSIKTPKSTKDGNQSLEEDLNISRVSSVGSLKISPRKSIRDIKTPNSAQTNKSIKMDLDTYEINNVFSRISPRKSLKSHISRQSTKISQEENTPLENPEVGENFTKTRLSSPRKSIKSPKVVRNNQSTDDDLDISEIENASPTRVSSQRKTATPAARNSSKINHSLVDKFMTSTDIDESVSPARVIPSRKSLKTPNNRVSSASRKTESSLSASLSSSEIDDNLSPVRPSSARKSLKSSSLNRDQTLVSSDVEEYSSPARNSLRKGTKTPSSTKVNQSTKKHNSSESTSISPTRVSLTDKHSILSSRRSRKTESLNMSVSSSEVDDNASLVRPSSARKSLKSSSLNRNKSLSSSDVEEYSSPVRNSLRRKSTKTPSSTKANQSTHEPLNSSVNTSISSTRASLKEKHSISGSRRSEKAGQSLNVSLSSSEVEDNLSPVKSSSPRKSLKSRSLNRDKSLGSSDVEENISPARNSLRKSTKTPSFTKANQSTHEPVNSSVNTSISSTRTSLKEKHSISGSRRSEKPRQSLNVSLTSSEVEDNLSPVRPSSTRKSSTSRSLNRDKSLGSSDVEEYISPARNSLRKSTTTPSFTKANQSTKEPLNSSVNTGIFSTRTSLKEKHSISGSRRSEKAGQSLNVSLTSSDVEDNVSPVRPSSTRKNSTSRSLNRDKSVGSSDVEEYISPARNSPRKSTKTPSSTKANKSTQEPLNSSVNTSISSTRASLTEKLSISGSRRSRKTGHALNESLSSSEVEDNLSPLKSSSARKSLKSRSLNQDESLGNSDIGEYDSPTRNTSRKSIKTPSSTKVNQSTSTSVSPRRSRKTNQSLNLSLSSSEVDDNVSPVRVSSSRKSIKTPSSVKNKSGIKSMRSDIEANLSRSAKRSKSMNQSVDSLDTSISSISSVTMSESEELNNARFSSTRKSASKSQRSVSFQPESDLGTSFTSLDISNIEYNQSSVEAYSVSPLKSTRKPITPRSAVKLDHIYSRRTKSISNISISTEDNDLNISSLSSILNNSQSRKSSRARKSTVENDFDYSSSSRKRRDSETGSGVYSLCSTIPAEALDVSVTTSRMSSNIADESTLENVSYSLDTSIISSRRSRTTEASVVDLTTPSPKRSRKSSVQYQPITEDITPVTPVANTKDEAGFKTPQNTPHVFENIRKSVLKSRSRHEAVSRRVSAGNDSIRKNVLNAGEGVKRPRESTGSVRSNKRMKLSTNEANSSIDSSFSSFDSEVFEADTPKHAAKNISVHQPDFSSRFSSDPQQKKSAVVRRSLQIVTNVENSKPVSTPPVSKKISQKGSKNDLSDVEGVKTLMKTPKTHKEPENDLSNVSGVKNLLKTPKIHKEPKNDLTNVAGVKKLLKTPKVQKEPKNDLSNIAGVKKLLKTPKPQNEPKNDLTNVAGVKKLLNTPKVQKEPKNDLSNVAGMKKILKTPKPQNEPNNDLRNVSGVKKLLKTPKVQKEPENNLINIPSFKKLFSPTKEAKSPKNDLTSVPNLRRIMSPKQQNTPKNDLTDVRGLKKLMKTPKETKEPLNDLTDVRGLKKLMRTPRTQKGPLNDLSDLEGVANIFSTSVHHRLSNTSDIENNEDLFNKLFDKKPLKTYRSKSTSPNKSLDAFGAVRKTIGDQPVVSPRVVDWIDEQKVLKERQTEISKPQSVKKGRKKTRVDELKDEVVPKKLKTRTKSQTSDGVQVPTISSTRTKVSSESEKDHLSEVSTEELDTYTSTEVKSTRRNRQRNENKTIEPQKTEVIESPQSRTRGRKGKQIVVETDEKFEGLDSLEEKNKIDVDSPKPRRGRRNITKVDDEPAVESPQTSTRSRRRVATQVDVHDEKPAKRTRNAKNDEPKTISLDSPLKSVATDTSTESPKITTKGRRKATTKDNEPEEEEHETPADSPKVTARGRRNKKVESIATDSPQGKSGRNKSKEDQEKPVDSPKVVARGRRNAKVVENDITSDVAQEKSGRNKSKEVMEETVDSPKVAVRGRRNAAKKVEEEAVVETVNSPKVPTRGRRAAKKTDNDVVSVESPKPKEKRNRRVKSIESTEELSKDVDSPKIETKKKTTKSAIAEEKLVQDSPKRTRRRPRAGVAVENIQEELPTSSKEENPDSPRKTEPTTKGKRGRGKKEDEIKKVDTHEAEKESEPANSPTKTVIGKRGRGKKQDEIKKVDTHEIEKESEPANSPTKTIKGKGGRGKKQDEIKNVDTHETEKETPNSPTKTKKDADTVKSTRGKRKQKEETEDVSEAVVPVAKRSKKGTPAEVNTDNEEKESSTTTKRTRRGKHEVEKEDEPEVESKRNKKATDADQKQSSKRKDQEVGTKKSKRGKVEEIVVEEPPTSGRSTRARGKRVQFID